MSVLVPMKRNHTIGWPTFGGLDLQLERLLNADAPATKGVRDHWVPAVDIQETEDAYLIEADLPGLAQKDIDVQVLEDRITIRGTRKREAKHKENGYWRYERSEGAFERSFRLRGGIDAAKVNAQFEKGVLSITVPKPESTKPRQINVKVK